MTKNNSNADLTEQGSLRRLAVTVMAIICGLLVTETGLTLWQLCFTFLHAPVAAIAMSVVLCVYLMVFSGAWPKDRGAVVRRTRFRRGRPGAWKRGWLAGLAIVFFLEAGIVLTFRLIPFPDAAFTSEYRAFGTLPVWESWMLVGMSSLVAGVCEETGFRGYMQVALERRWGVLPSVLLTSLVFTLIHLGKPWSGYIIPLIFFTSVLLGLLAVRTGSLIPSILAHTVFDVVNFSYWWSHLAGRFRMQTVFVTGIDVPFVATLLVFGSACVVFFREIKKARPKGE